MLARFYVSRPAVRRRLQLLLFAPLLALAACGGSSGAGWGPGSTQGNNSTNHITQQGGLIIFAAPTLQQVLPALTDAFFKARRLTIPYTFNFSGDQVNANTANTLADADLLIADNQQTLIDARRIGFVQSTGTPLATDTLSVIVPASNPATAKAAAPISTGFRFFSSHTHASRSRCDSAILCSIFERAIFGATPQNASLKSKPRRRND